MITITGDPRAKPEASLAAISRERQGSLEVSVGSLGEKRSAELFRGWTKDAVGQRELDLRVVELQSVGALAVLGGYGCGADDLDRLESSTVSSCHVIVHRVDGIVEGDITVLPVHVVRSTSRVVFDPDGIVLDVRRLLLSDLSIVR